MKSLYTSYGNRPVSIALESLDGNNCDFINVSQIFLSNQEILSQSNRLIFTATKSNQIDVSVNVNVNWYYY